MEPLLDDVSTTAFYLAARGGQIDTVEFAYVDGYEGCAPRPSPAKTWTA